MTTETEAAGKAAESAGMPQLDFSTFPNQIFWLVVTLLVIYFVLSRLALPRIGSVLAERSGTISNDLAAAEELKQRAVQAEHAYDAALVASRVEAGAIMAEAKAGIQKDLDKAVAKADGDIAARAAVAETAIAEIRAGAVDAVGEVARDTADALVAAMGGSADARTVAAAVAARMKG